MAGSKTFSVDAFTLDREKKIVSLWQEVSYAMVEIVFFQKPVLDSFNAGKQ